MLVTLNVKNFAIIGNIQIDFENGLTVLTGETGAGKSLIIDAISLLFGERASNELIRHGEQKATIEGVFSNYDNKIIEYLQEYNIEYDENEFLIIKRERHLIRVYSVRIFWRNTLYKAEKYNSFLICFHCIKSRVLCQGKYLANSFV